MQISCFLCVSTRRLAVVVVSGVFLKGESPLSLMLSVLVQIPSSDGALCLKFELNPPLLPYPFALSPFPSLWLSFPISISHCTNARLSRRSAHAAAAPSLAASVVGPLLSRVSSPPLAPPFRTAFSLKVAPLFISSPTVQAHFFKFVLLWRSSH